MRIAFICDGDPTNKRLWSGTVSSIYGKIIENNEVLVVDVSKGKRFIKFIYKIFSKLIKITTKKKFYGSFGKLNALKESKTVSRFLRKNKNIDVVFCVSKSSSIAFIKTDKPIIYLIDATFASMENYYDYLSGLCRMTQKNAHKIERLALNKSTKIICASEWVKRSAINDYGVLEEKTVVIPFGANVSDPSESEGEVNECINLLFCGVEWERKGGDVAIETYKKLVKKGKKVKLYLVGCKPPYQIDDQGIINVGFLNKNDPIQASRLESIYASCDFLVLPTKAEAAGIVFIEASAHGIPSITYNTGGVGSYVVDGENGFKLPVGASADVFADKIIEIVQNRDLYLTLKKKCKMLYLTRYNWNAWKKDFDDVLNACGV